MNCRHAALIASICLAAVGCSDDDEPTRTNDTPDPGPVTLIAADRAGDLYSVDAATGAETLLRSTSAAGGRGDEIGVVSALVYVPTNGTLLAGMGGNSVCPGCLMTIDPDTGVATMLSFPDVSEGIPGLAIRESDDALFFGEGDGSKFYQGNPVTGTHTEIGTDVAASSGRGLTFAADGTLYMAGHESLYEVDADAGTSVELGELTLIGFSTPPPTNFSIGSMTTRPSDGAILGILKIDGGSGGSGPTHLVRVDPSAVTATNLGQHGVKLDGLAFVPELLFE